LCSTLDWHSYDTLLNFFPKPLYWDQPSQKDTKIWNSPQPKFS